MYSRAVHLEVLDNMSTDSFINALRCFLCILKEVHSIYCDNSTNLVRVNNEFVKLLSQTDPTLLSYFTEHNIEFVVIKTQVQVTKEVFGKDKSKLPG